MRFKKVLFSLLAIIIFSNVIISSKELKPPIFMGKVMEVTTASDGKTLMVRVKGYIKSCQVYEEEVIALIGEETKVLKECQDDNKKNDSNKIVIEKGANVYIVFSNIFTNSLPPQSLAKKILISNPQK